MSKRAPTKKKTRSQEQQAARQLQLFVNSLGVEREKIIELGDVAQRVIKQPEAWPAFAEVLREDPGSPVNYQLLSQLAAMGAAAARGDVNTKKAAKAPTPKASMDALAALGRNGDTELAHVTPEEKALLESRGGAGTINPVTGLPEYWNPLKDLKNAINKVGNWIDDNVLQPVKNFVVKNPAIVTLATTFLLPGLGTTIGTALGASGTAAAALGAAVISGGTTALSGGDLKDIFLSAGLGAGSAVLAPVIGGNLAPGASQAVQQAVSGAVIGGGVSALRGGNAAEILRAAVTGGAVGYVSNIANEALGGITNKSVNQQSFEDAAFAAADAAQLKAAGLSNAQIAQTLNATGVDYSAANFIAGQVGSGVAPGQVAAKVANNYGSKSIYSSGSGNTTSVSAGNVDAYQKTEDSILIAEDAAQLKAQGLSNAQIEETLIRSGVDPKVAQTAAAWSSTGKDTVALQVYNKTDTLFNPDTSSAWVQQQDFKASAADFLAADAQQLRAQGLSQRQITDTLVASGANYSVAASAATQAMYGYDTDTIARNLINSYGSNRDFYTGTLPQAEPTAPVAPTDAGVTDAEFIRADAEQLTQQGLGVNQVADTLVASGVDAKTAYDAAQLASITTPYDAGVSDAEFAAADARQLTDQGLSPDQVAQTLNYSGMDAQAAMDAAQLAAQGLDTGTITTNIDQAYGNDIYTNQTPEFTEPGMTGLPAPVDDKSVVSQDIIDRINAGETSLLDSLTPTQIAAIAGLIVAPALGIGQAEQPGPRQYSPIDIPEFGGPGAITTQGLPVNPGLITAQPFYQTTNQAQPQYFWGTRPLVQTQEDLANYNNIPWAPQTPFGYNVQLPTAQPTYQSVGEFLTAPEQQYAAMGTSPQYAGAAPQTTTYQPAVTGAVAPQDLTGFMAQPMTAAPVATIMPVMPAAVNNMVAPYYTTQGVTQ